MSKSVPNPKVDFYFIKNKQWSEEIEKLRSILLDTGLNEELKWGVPCYTLETGETGKQSLKRNIALIHVFKEYCAVLFFKGALLKDPSGVLIQQTENVQAARQMRFTNSQEIAKRKTALKALLKEAIEVERSGKKVELKKTKEFPMPDEFKNKLDKDATLKKAFYNLTPGRQRGYLLHFASAKQSATRVARVEKYASKIKSGKGLDD